MADLTPEQAREALDVVGRAHADVAHEVGLPRWYWWVMAIGWMIPGVCAAFGPAWLTTVATVAFGVGHSAVASRLLDGRRRTRGLQVSRAVADRRVPLAVILMLVALVGVTIVAAVILHADGTRHPELWSAVLVAAVIGFGGPEMLQTTRRWMKA